MEVYVMRELKDTERDGRLTIWPARRGCLIGSAGALGWRVAELTGRRLDSLYFPRFMFLSESRRLEFDKHKLAYIRGRRPFSTIITPLLAA